MEIIWDETKVCVVRINGVTVERKVLGVEPPVAEAPFWTFAVEGDKTILATGNIEVHVFTTKFSAD